MTALLVSIVVWGVVVFMATDDYCRKKEKNSLRFLMLVGVVLTAVGLWRFKIDQLREVSIHDWVLLSFLPISFLYLRLKTTLVKKQSEAQEQEISLVELNLDAIPDKCLVRQFRILSVVMWGYAVAMLVFHLWSRSGVSI